MPKSKRNKQIDLSKTKKHGLEGKKKLFEEVRSCVETYTHLFIFSVNDMRNSKIKSVREQWKHSRFFIGKNKVMAKALGMNAEDEFRMNLHKIGRRLKGERGLLFSNQSIEEVLKWFSSYSEGDFARSGNCATETVILKEGPLSQFPHNLEPYLRQLGLPTTLKKGIIHLVKDHTVCNVGDVLTPETAKIVKLLGYEMAEFYIKIECVWSQDGSFSDFAAGEETKENINEINSSLTLKQTTNEAAVSMDVDNEEVVEPSDEMIESIIMKNRKSLMDSKAKQIENNTSSNESSDEEEMVDLNTSGTTNNKPTLEQTVENKVSEFISLLKNDSNKDDSSVMQDKETSKSVDDATMGTEIEDSNKQVNKTTEEISVAIAHSTEDADRPAEDNDTSLSSSAVVQEVGSEGNVVEEATELMEETKTIINNNDNDEKHEDASDDNESEDDDADEAESEDEEIPELVEDADSVNELNDNTQANDESSKAASNENSLKRLSLDKSVLQSPVMLEKRPKFSPKMTRSAMKAKKTVSKTDANKINEQSESSNDKTNGEQQQPSRGRAHKRHSTGESPVERKLRNRSIKIVKKKK